MILEWNLAMINGKRETAEGIELPNQESIRTFGEKESKYLGISQADTIKQAELKERIRKEYLKRTRKFLKNKLCCWNLLNEMNTRLIK